jgi:hypothetical protein
MDAGRSAVEKHLECCPEEPYGGAWHHPSPVPFLPFHGQSCLLALMIQQQRDKIKVLQLAPKDE